MCEEDIFNRKNEFQEETKKERNRAPQQEIEAHSFMWQMNTLNHCIAQDVIKFNLEELFYLVEVSQFDFSEEETSCGNEKMHERNLTEDIKD